MHMKIRKYLFALLAGCAAWTALPAQNKLLDSPSRKLQLAEFAISNLYVDKVDEDKLVKPPLSACWKSSTRTPPIPTRKK